MAEFDYRRKFAEVSVKGRSNFDLSHKNLLTTKCGTLTPVLTEEMIPGEKIHLKAAVNACLPPLASETFMNVNLELNAFFVPSRLLYGGYESWLTQEPIELSNGDKVQISLPYMTVSSASSNQAYVQPGTLADYLGFKTVASESTQGNLVKLNILPFLAYHKIWDDHYRNTVVQKSCWLKPLSSSNNLYNLPYKMFSGTSAFSITSQFYDGTRLGELRQRNFDFDRYVSSMPTSQRGEAQSVNMTVTPASGDTAATTSFTIKALRAANQLQIWAEKAQFSYKLQDYVKSQYGAHLSNGVAQRSLWLGRQIISVYSKGVEQNAPTQQGDDYTTNPFSNVGAQYGRAVCVGNGTLIDTFEADEPGYLMVIACLVPKVTYGSGVRRYLTNYTEPGSQVDMPNANLQGTGNEPVYNYELVSSYLWDRPDSVFGYNDKYSWIMDHSDELHGLVRDGQSLQSFALQRTLTGSSVSQISDAFLKIPTNYLDQVFAAGDNVSQYGCWMDCFFDFKATMPLAVYSIPTLEDPAREHGKKVKIKKGGESVY